MASQSHRPLKVMRDILIAAGQEHLLKVRPKRHVSLGSRLAIACVAGLESVGALSFILCGSISTLLPREQAASRGR
jgi:hypothetical protein